MCDQTSDKFLSEEKNLNESLRLMIEHMETYRSSAKRHRLDCLYFLIIHVFKVDVNIYFLKLAQGVQSYNMKLLTNMLV